MISVSKRESSIVGVLALKEFTQKASWDDAGETTGATKPFRAFCWVGGAGIQTAKRSFNELQSAFAVCRQTPLIESAIL